MYPMSQCILLDHLDQFQTKFEISPIHQVYSYCNMSSTISASELHLWTDSATEGWRMKYTNIFLVLHDSVTVMQSNWWIEESLEMELHLQAFLLLIDSTFTASFLAVLVLACCISDGNTMSISVKPHGVRDILLQVASLMPKVAIVVQRKREILPFKIGLWCCHILMSIMWQDHTKIVKCNTSKGIVGSFIRIFRLASINCLCSLMERFDTF